MNKNNSHALSRAITGFGLLILCVTWAILLTSITNDRAAKIEDARKETGNLVTVLSEHICATFTQIENSMYFMRQIWETSPDAETMTGFFRYLVTSRRDLFNLVSIIDANGNVLLTDLKESPSTYSGDRDFFVYHKENSDRQLRIAQPIPGRVTGKWYIPVSLRLQDSRGNFAGVLLASVNPYYFSMIFRETKLGKNSLVYLADQNGVIYSGMHGGKELDLNSKVAKFSPATSQEIGHISNTTESCPVDQVLQIKSMRSIPVHTLGVAVAVGFDEYMQTTTFRNRLMLLVQSGFSLIIIIFIIGLRKAIASRDAFSKELTESEQRFRALFMMAPLPLVEETHDGKTIRLNECFTQTLGYTIEDIPNIDAWWLLAYPDPAYRKKVKQRWEFLITRAHTLNQPIIYGNDFRVTCKNGISKNVIIHASIVGDRTMVSIFDISDRKRAEDALRLSEEKYRLLFDTAADPIFIHDENAHILAANQRASERFGYTNDEFQTMTVMQMEAPEQISQVASRIEQAISIRRVSFETQLRHKDGTLIPHDVNAKPIFWDGKPAILSICRDISERKKAEQERQILEDNLRQRDKLDAIGQLAGGVAHDFNNMLGGILAAADFLEIQLRNAPQKQREMVSLIIQSASRAADLTAQLRVFAHKQPSVTNVIDITSPLNDAITLFKYTADKRIKITTALGDQPLLVCGDQSLLQSMVLNMLINSSHAMPNGGTINISAGICDITAAECGEFTSKIEPGSYVSITIKDSGCGIPAEVLPHIFEPFFTTKPIGQGTGLGLSAVFDTVKQHHGAISVSSPQGEGASFRILLPQAHITVPLENDSAPKVIHGSATILLVDDELVMRQSGSAILEQLGYNVLLAENGVQCLEVYKKKHDEIDLILLDMAMPEMNGYDCFFALKALNPRVQVIVLTGFAGDKLLKKMLAEGLLAIISKPYRLTNLSQIIHDALNV